MPSIPASNARAIARGLKAKVEAAIRLIDAGEWGDAHDKLNEIIEMATTLRDNV